MFEIKTLIELFDFCQVENVIAGLRFAPQKIVFVGFDNIMTRKRRNDLETFFIRRGLDVDVEFAEVDRYSYADIEEKLNKIIDENEDCCFDLTGGKELVLAAMGHISATRNIPMLQFDVKKCAVIPVKGCEEYQDKKLSMKIKDCIELNGGAIVFDSDIDFKWNMSESFKNDIRMLWDVCKRDSRIWNKQITAFADFVVYGNFDKKTLCVKITSEQMAEVKKKIFINNRLISLLEKFGYILDFENSGESVKFRFKNEQVYRCLSKAGNILELYTYMCALKINEDEIGYYADIDTGVRLDWDGVIHDSSTAARDTRNEIDVMLMRNLVPVFISCKNGDVKKEALYELSAVSNRLGGKYVKQLIVMSHISSEMSKEFIKQRANDMKIDVIENVEELTEAEFIAELKRKTKIA